MKVSTNTLIVILIISVLVLVALILHLKSIKDKSKAFVAGATYELGAVKKDCSYKTKKGCTGTNGSKMGCKWDDASSSCSRGGSTPKPSPTPKPGGGGGKNTWPGGINCPEVTGKVQARNMNGKPVDWWVIIKWPSSLVDGSTSCGCSECPNTPKPGKGAGACYYYMDNTSSAPTWYGSGNCLNTCDNALSKTIAQATGTNNFGVWNDALDQPWTSSGTSCSAPRAHSKGMVCYDKEGGFVLNVSTPHFPQDSSNPGNSPAGCQNDDNLSYAQHFFCMSLDTSNLKVWGDAAENAKLCGSNNAWDVGDILSRTGKPGGTTQPHVKLETMGGTPIVMTVKSGSDYVNPWSIVSASLGKELEVVSWTSLDDGSSGWGNADCFSSSTYPAKGMVQVATMGNQEHGIFKTVNSHTHAKFAISKGDNSGNWITLGSMNQQDSQAKRGGEFYSIQNEALWKALNAMIQAGSTKTPKKCGV